MSCLRDDYQLKNGKQNGQNDLNGIRSINIFGVRLYPLLFTLFAFLTFGFIYVGGYGLLRCTHVIVHKSGVEGSWFEPENGPIFAVYGPMIFFEIDYRNLSYDPGIR